MKRRTVLTSAAALAAVGVAPGRAMAARTKTDARVSDSEIRETTVLARAGQGAHTWRIPALAVHPDGTIIAGYDRRNDSDADLPANIDVVVRTSTDLGKSWSDPIVVADYSGGTGVGDASLLVDETTGRVFAFYSYCPPGIGFANSGTGNDPDSTSIQHTDYSYSDDSGKTWTHRRITADIKDPSWNGIFAASGSGIQLSSGRLIQQYALRKDGENYAASAYSDDHGDTWRMGGLVGPGLDENKTVELADGRVMLNSRPGSGSSRLVAYSDDQGLSYGTPKADSNLPDPKCNGAVLRYDTDAAQGDDKAEWLLFSNPTNTGTRKNLTVRLSRDSGGSWPVSRTVDTGMAAYSTLARLSDGTFGVFYEGGDYANLTFVRFNIAWLTNG